MSKSAVRDESAEERRMPTNVEGEFELVLGNKQLMSVFFIVVVLLGIFFAMGYVVGRNLAPEEIAASPEKPIEVASAVPAPSGGTETPTPAPKPVETAPPAPDTRPSPIPSQPVEKPKPVEVPKPPAPTPTPAPPVTKPTPTPPVAKPASGGMYLQVVATTADKVPQVTQKLTGLGYRSTTQPVPDSALVRVLAGPFDADLLPKAQEELAKAGFKSFPRRP